MTKTITRITTSAIILLLCFATSSIAATSTYAGRISSVEGSVMVKKVGSPELSEAVQGTRIEIGDNVITGEGAKARVTLPDKSALLLGEKTRVKLSKFSLDTKYEDREVHVLVYSGSARVLVMKIMKTDKFEGWRPWYNHSFRVVTPTADISTLSSDFFVDLSEGGGPTKITVAYGTINVRNRNGKIRGSRIVTANQTTLVESMRPPTLPQIVDAHYLETIYLATFIEGPAFSMVGAGSTDATPVGEYISAAEIAERNAALTDTAADEHAADPFSDIEYVEEVVEEEEVVVIEEEIPDIEELDVVIQEEVIEEEYTQEEVEEVTSTPVTFEEDEFPFFIDSSPETGLKANTRGVTTTIRTGSLGGGMTTCTTPPCL
ncbi:MAG: FecR domain-containing protein [Deltaproteobacteria bacterium]|nr:FecR domain-containing protein [Deltaproteobacteria bacterium]